MDANYKLNLLWINNNHDSFQLIHETLSYTRYDSSGKDKMFKTWIHSNLQFQYTYLRISDWDQIHVNALRSGDKKDEAKRWNTDEIQIHF